jgi:hypothetical protein
MEHTGSEEFAVSYDQLGIIGQDLLGSDAPRGNDGVEVIGKPKHLLRVIIFLTNALQVIVAVVIKIPMQPR